MLVLYSRPVAREIPYPLLRELPRPLVPAVAEQFNDAALVWCETSDFLNDVTDEGGALAEVALHAGNARLHLAGGDFL